MFVCGVCKKVSERREKAVHVITKLRKVDYLNKESISHGTEIVEEMLVAPSHKHDMTKIKAIFES